MTCSGSLPAAIRSATVFNFDFSGTTRKNGDVITREMGWNAVAGSYDTGALSAFVTGPDVLMSMVDPSGGEWATNPAPMDWFAPGRLSTMIFWPRLCDITGSIRRATISMPPPAGAPTTSLTMPGRKFLATCEALCVHEQRGRQQ